MTFKDALHTVSAGIVMKIVLPSFVMRLSASLRKIDLAFNELQVWSSNIRGAQDDAWLGQAYMKEMIQERLESVKTERNDLFATLLEANGLDEGALTNDELIGR